MKLCYNVSMRTILRMIIYSQLREAQDHGGGILNFRIIFFGFNL